MKDKLEKLKKLADAMYYAAKYLTTDASRLHNAMDEYHKFVILEYHNRKEDSVNNGLDLGCGVIWRDEEPVSKIIFDGNFNKSWYAHPELAFKAGMKEMREQMMKEAIERTVKIDAGGYPYIDCDSIELYDYDKDVPLAKEGDKYKVILIKEG